MDDTRDASVGTRTRVPGSGLPGDGDAGADLPGAGLPGADVPGADLPGADFPGGETRVDLPGDETGADQSGAGVHPVLGCAAVIEDALSAVTGVDPMFLAAADKRAALLRLRRVRTRLEALELKLTACAGDVAAADGDPNVAAWLVPRTLEDPRTEHRAEKLARRLATRWTLTQTALGAALLNTAQAQVIVEALEVLHAADLGVPAEVKTGLLGQAEQTLLGYAAEFGPKQLRVLGRRILQVLAPELFDEEERKRLEEEERRAHARTRLSLHRNGDGTTTLRATLPDAVALRLKNLLEAYTSPRHPGTRPHGGNNPGADGAGEDGAGTDGTGGDGAGTDGTRTDGAGTDGAGENGTGENSTGDNGSDQGGSADDDGSGQDGSADHTTGQDNNADDVSGQHGTGDRGGAGRCCAGEHGSEPGSGSGSGSGVGAGSGLGLGVPLVDPATGEKVPHDQRMGLALQAFLEALDPARLPIKAGAGTSLLVTIDYEHLRRGVGVATLPNGDPISAGETRRLACACGILPAVLGGDSHVLDLGRLRRLFEWAQRIAKRITTFTCQAYGCTVPADWCEAHHGRTPWAEGGTTDLADLDFLCPFHHHRAHDPAYRVERLPNGDYRFHRRT
jgi:hypothetical protein